MSNPITFTLDPVLHNDTLFVCQLPLCEVRLMNDSQYPWLILVPQVDAAAEIIDLTEAQQLQLLRESRMASQVLKTLFLPDKLNIAALGNVVKQLHIHHIARYTSDIAWPAPVWGKFPSVVYAPEQADEVVRRLRDAIAQVQAT
jgi:diadenosine tetraphosphate (Ap4A) HIT family hydrolase